MNISNYNAELMKQEFSDSVGFNYTKFGFILFLKKHKFIIPRKNVNEMFEFTYRFLIDNKDYTSLTSNVLIKNIDKYSLIDLKPLFEESLKSWISIGNGILMYDGETILTNPNLILSKEDLLMLDKVVDLISLKNFKKIIVYSDSLEADALIVSNNLDNFEKYIYSMIHSRFKNRGSEIMDYCCCCENVDKNSLVLIHINFNGDLSDSKNLIVMCKEHAELYFNSYFRFYKTGKIHILKNHCALDKRMHISKKVMKTRNLCFFD